MLELANVILAAVLGLCALGMVGGTVVILWRYSKALSTATEIIVRHQDEANSYQKKGLAEALASGRQPAYLTAGESRGTEKVPSAIANLARAAAEDVDAV